MDTAAQLLIIKLTNVAEEYKPVSHFSVLLAPIANLNVVHPDVARRDAGSVTWEPNLWPGQTLVMTLHLPEPVQALEELCPLPWEAGNDMAVAVGCPIVATIGSLAYPTVAYKVPQV